MKKSIIRNARLSYTLAGIVFGFLFPAAALTLEALITDTQFYLWILIWSAPFWLGLVAFIAGQRQDKAVSLTRSLESEVERRTSSLRNLMDLSGQGFLYFSSDFKVQPEYSKECEEIFGRAIVGEDIGTLLYRDEKTQQEFRQGVSLFFEGKAKAGVIFDLLEQESFIEGRFIAVEFRVLSDDQVMCVLTDTTADKNLEDKIRKENEDKAILLRAVSNRQYFGSFLHEASHLFDFISVVDGLRNKVSKLDELLRMVHTFKGNAAFFGFTQTQEVAHDFEYYIADHLTLGGDIELYEISIDLKRSYYAELSVITDTLGKRWIEEADGVIIPNKDYFKIENYIKKKLPAEKRLAAVIEHYRKVPFRDLFSRFPDMAKSTAESLGKKIAPLEITGGDAPVIPERFEDLTNSLVHIIRNMVDHGIENMAEREMMGKDSAGHLAIDIRETGNYFTISLSDDGQGISTAAIATKAKEKGWIKQDDSPDDETLLRFIFRQDFSTADSITQVSGRGVGLTAVKQEVEKLGGKISVSSKLQEGTTFEIMIPVKQA